MIHFSDHEKELITSLWGQADVENICSDSLIRLLMVYPWTRRYFHHFVNIHDAQAIIHNLQVKSQGKKVLHAFGEVVKHLDNI
ncbi:hemoglobin subunit beta-like [Alligator mississippiensis]|uniref:Hemoglobin subunit beta-like n=2 Tax=Alligator mississippiensis TaxID=8496 RepID=A0A151PG28_ALLMI|nr:hemoglobin subunit beta-like [Alligator mississippiensis]